MYHFISLDFDKYAYLQRSLDIISYSVGSVLRKMMAISNRLTNYIDTPSLLGAVDCISLYGTYPFITREINIHALYSITDFFFLNS